MSRTTWFLNIEEKFSKDSEFTIWFRMLRMKSNKTSFQINIYDSNLVNNEIYTNR